MTDTTAFNATSHPIVTLEGDWNNLVDHGLEKCANYIVRKNGSYYEAIYGAGTTTYGNIAYGGSASAGSVSGTDFSAVMNACIGALTSGGKIYLTQGTYVATSQITVTNYISIIGAGMQTTVITFDDSFSCIKTAGTAVTAVTGVYLAMFTVQGGNDGTSGVAFDFNYTYSNTSFYNLQAKNVGGIGFKFTNCHAIRNIGLEASNCEDSGFQYYNCHGTDNNIKAYDCGQDANNPNIAVYYSANMELHCVSEGTHGTLLHIDDNGGNLSQAISISGYFEGSKRVTIKDCRGVSIHNARFNGDSADYALVIDGDTMDVTVRECTFIGDFSGAAVWIVAGTVYQTAFRDIAYLSSDRFLNDSGVLTTFDNIRNLYLERYGTATILSGNNSVSVTHNLADTPDYILVTGTAVACGSFIAYGEGAATFTAGCENNATADTTVWWFAKCAPPATWPV